MRTSKIVREMFSYTRTSQLVLWIQNHYRLFLNKSFFEKKSLKKLYKNNDMWRKFWMFVSQSVQPFFLFLIVQIRIQIRNTDLNPLPPFYRYPTDSSQAIVASKSLYICSII